MALTIVAQFQARPGEADALEEQLRALVLPTRAEDGCEVYELHRSLQKEGFFHFHEIWTTREQWEAHMRSDHLRAFQAASEAWVETVEILELEKLL